MNNFVDILVLVLFIFMLIMFIRGFNKQQLAKHEKRLKENKAQAKNKKKSKIK
jgi:hypothetical protein